MLASKYFSQIRKTEDFIEVQSKNTNHCWVIKKSLSNQSGKILLFHKHSLKDSYYHKQTKKPLLSVKQAIELIQSHDDYVLTLTFSNNL